MVVVLLLRLALAPAFAVALALGGLEVLALAEVPALPPAFVVHLPALAAAPASPPAFAPTDRLVLAAAVLASPPAAAEPFDVVPRTELAADRTSPLAVSLPSTAEVNAVSLPLSAVF